MKHENNTKIGKTSKKKGNNKLIIAAIVMILFVGIVYAVTISAKDSHNTPMSLKEIRAQIDSEYSSRGVGTKTPAVVDNYSPILSPRKVDKLPDYAYTNAMALKSYRFATEHPEIFEQMPCYCGCGEHGSTASEGKPHKFLRDCFIKDNGEYDNHASFCDTCIGIGAKVQSLLSSNGAKPL